MFTLEAPPDPSVRTVRPGGRQIPAGTSRDTEDGTLVVIQKIGSIGEGRKLKQLQGIVGLVNTFEPEVEDLTDAELKGRSAEFKQRLADGETLDDILPEAFAVVREAARRTLGQFHYKVQLMGGAALHLGNIAEMKTGEGKTLTGVLPAYLNALSGDGVHVVTTNDYLAQRDADDRATR